MAGSLPVFTASYSNESKQRSEGIAQLEHCVWARGDKKYSVRNWGRGGCLRWGWSNQALPFPLSFEPETELCEASDPVRYCRGAVAGVSSG